MGYESREKGHEYLKQKRKEDREFIKSLRDRGYSGEIKEDVTSGLKSVVGELLTEGDVSESCVIRRHSCRGEEVFTVEYVEGDIECAPVIKNAKYAFTEEEVEDLVGDFLDE